MNEPTTTETFGTLWRIGTIVIILGRGYCCKDCFWVWLYWLRNIYGPGSFQGTTLQLYCMKGSQNRRCYRSCFREWQTHISPECVSDLLPLYLFLDRTFVSMKFVLLIDLDIPFKNRFVFFVFFLEERKKIRVDIVGLFSDESDVEYQYHCFVCLTEVAVSWQFLLHLFSGFYRLQLEVFYLLNLVFDVVIGDVHPSGQLSDLQLSLPDILQG